MEHSGTPGTAEIQQQISPAHLERLEVDISPGLAALGTLPLPCTTLGMVLQNLIQHAAEAGAGRARAHLHIEAELLATDHERSLRLGLSDDTLGVAPEDLPKLFQKGYSSNPQAAGSGLGLHWCANALNALGGAITAQSDGPGRGTRFEVLMPLREIQPKAGRRAA